MKEWVKLTEQDLFDALRPNYTDDETTKTVVKMLVDDAKAIEAKVKEKNYDNRN